jgi:hypothetical protein
LSVDKVFVIPTFPLKKAANELLEEYIVVGVADRVPNITKSPKNGKSCEAMGS